MQPHQVVMMGTASPPNVSYGQPGFGHAQVSPYPPPPPGPGYYPSGQYYSQPSSPGYQYPPPPPGPGQYYQSPPVYMSPQPATVVYAQPMQQTYATQPMQQTYVTAQPMYGQVMASPMQQIVWMPPIGPIENCPRGLEYLTKIDQLIIKQEAEILEAVLGIETSNKYRIFNSLYQQCYYAFESSNFCSKQCCSENRGFTMYIQNNLNEVVFTIDRPFNCCKDNINVIAKDGTLLGKVHRKYNFCCCSPQFLIYDHNSNPCYKIKGPCCKCTLCDRQIEFPIHKLGSDIIIGSISKKWSGMVKEMFTDADTFGVTFPIELDARMKATIIGAVFLIDFMYFESG
ncbi:phospholipid scramblase 2-like [Physella acuta]|uniref:phospholipid scramblase 2-like n=1 Tax=Physella acuta TaxID=109671 RepID=UPI0027DD187C|nr:phospholipid scramblase 2-like [Physella acuta]